MWKLLVQIVQTDAEGVSQGHSSTEYYSLLQPADLDCIARSLSSGSGMTPAPVPALACKPQSACGPNTDTPLVLWAPEETTGGCFCFPTMTRADPPVRRLSFPVNATCWAGDSQKFD